MNPNISGDNALNIMAQAESISPIGTIGRLIEIGADAVLLVGTIAVLVYLLMGAFKWITAGGEKGKIEEARTMMTQAIVGIVLLAAVFAIYSLVLNFIGLGSRINLDGGTNTNITAPGTGGGGGGGVPGRFQPTP